MRSTTTQNLWVTQGITNVQLWVVIQDLHTAMTCKFKALCKRAIEYTVYSAFTHRYVHSLGITSLSVNRQLYTVYTPLTIDTTRF
jgi:hypothetical protein